MAARSGSRETRVAIVTNNILHYRIPLFTQLSRHFSLVVIHSGDDPDQELPFEAHRVGCFKGGPFFIQYGILSERLSSYDVVVFMCDIRWIVSLLLFKLIRHKVRTVWWGGWQTNRKFLDPIKVWFLNQADARLFYCRRHISEFLGAGMIDESNFVAVNTVHVERPVDSSPRDKGNSLLFVGALAKRKRLDLVIDAISILREDNITMKLEIVGSGPIENALKMRVIDLGLEDQIIFHGRIEDNEKLVALYSEALAAISPGQAGLSVLQSMAMGVPFITYKNAISGGERDNISNGVNGILLDSLNGQEIKRVLLESCKGNIDLRQMGHEAFIYYTNRASMKHMVDGFTNAISG